jgi:uncharacterized MAPEG superfamily protein
VARMREYTTNPQRQPLRCTRRVVASPWHEPSPPLVAGLLFVLTGPSLSLARWMLYGFAASRVLHFLAYASAQVHEVRATFWTIGSVILMAMCVIVLRAAWAAA